jgi:uncharacterized membrane protein
MSDAYYFWKTAHILSATILFGTGIGIAFFCWFGYRTALRSGDISTLRSFLRLTVAADAGLTAPSVVFQAISGAALMTVLGWSHSSDWAVLVWTLYVFVGACWLPVVGIQIRLKREADRASTIAALPRVFHRMFLAWIALGVPVFCAVVVIVYLMVAKPPALMGL